ncbi:hypothetical protein [Nocardiopsis flavescens]|nr:hypothetical protein [Nocardiopsis flavescens]
MNGIGFLPLLWVNSALEAGLFPTTRAHTVASAIAEAADRDGRWCYLYLDTLTRRCGGTLSRSTAKRALRDLLHHRLVRKLPRTQSSRHPAPGEHLTHTPTTGLLQLTDRPTHTRTADRILLLHRGRVTETGTHHQLLVRGGAYARLYALRGTHRTPRP